jgi:hydrogenase-4 membrane subunit HyfE
MSVWQAVTWDIARAGGFTAFALLTLSVVIGLALTLHWQSPRWPRIINNELHNFITLLALIFTVVHVLAVWIDPFTNFGWNEVFIPLASHYRPLWMALGIVAFYIGIAIGISTWLRPLIGYKLWRNLHVLTLLLYGLVVVHGIATGSDTRTWWGAAIYALSVLFVGILLWMRLSQPANPQSHAHPVLAGVVMIAILIGVIWSILGPFESGWNAIANNGNGSGATSASLIVPSQKQPQQSTTFPQSFTGNLQGQLTQDGPDGNGNVTLRLNMNISNGPAGTLQVILQGQSGGVGNGGINITSSNVTLTSGTGQQIYIGSLSNIYGRNSWHMEATLTGKGQNTTSQLAIQMDVQIYANGQASGTITVGTTNVPGNQITPAGNSNTNGVNE